MTTVFFIADLHLGHNKEFIYKRRGFTCVEEHDEYIIDQWNKNIRKRDVVWCLGDMAFGRAAISSLERLRGIKHLVLGNHDRTNMQHYVGIFSRICGVFSYKAGILTHVPCHPMQLKHRYAWNIHGHTHEYCVTITDGHGGLVRHPQYYNVSVDQLKGLKPIAREELGI
tara:strand:- start:164 stop:670 length:507 start_codon:yes stop_codon:yes gene_type:complete